MQTRPVCSAAFKHLTCLTHPVVFFSGYFKRKGTTVGCPQSFSLGSSRRRADSTSTTALGCYGALESLPSLAAPETSSILSSPCLCLGTQNSPFLGQSCWFHQAQMAVGLWRAGAAREGGCTPHTAQHSGLWDRWSAQSQTENKYEGIPYAKAPFSVWTLC